MTETKMITDAEGEVVAIEVGDRRIPLRESKDMKEMKPYMQALHRIIEIIPLEDMKMARSLTQDGVEEFVRYMTPIQKALVKVLMRRGGYISGSDLKKKLGGVGIEDNSEGGYKIAGTTAGLTRKINSWEMGVPIIEREWSPELGQRKYKLNDRWRTLLEGLL